MRLDDARQHAIAENPLRHFEIDVNRCVRRSAFFNKVVQRQKSTDEKVRVIPCEIQVVRFVFMK